MSLSYKFADSPIGKLKLVASDKGLVAILWEKENPRRVRLEELVEDANHSVLRETERQLKEYFAGKRQSFSLPLDMRGTRFPKPGVGSASGHSIWRNTELRTIGESVGQSESHAGGRCGEWQKSHRDRCAVPPRDWIFRQTYRLRGRSRSEGSFTRPGGQRPEAFHMSTASNVTRSIRSRTPAGTAGPSRLRR